MPTNLSASDLATDLDNESSTDSTADDDRQYDDAPNVKVTPEVLIAFEEVLDVGFAGGIDNDQNIRGGRRPNTPIITVKNPRLGADDTVWQATNGDFIDFVVVDMDNENVSVATEVPDDAALTDDGVSAEVVGVDRYGSTFRSEKVDTDVLESHDVVQLWINGACGQRLLQVLDGHGAVAANDDPRGLLEYPPEYGTDGYSPSNGDLYPRAANIPQLRTDLVGEDGVFLFYLDGDDPTVPSEAADEDDDGGTYRAHRVHVLHGDPADMNVLEPTSEKLQSERDAYTVWADDTGGDNDGGDETASGTDDVSADGLLDDVQANGQSATTPSAYDDLSGEWQALVDDMVAQLDQMSMTPDDLKDWDQKVDALADEQGVPAHDADTVATIVEARL